MPLKSTLPKESQTWLIGKETAGGIWCPPSEITINCFLLKTTYYCQRCHSMGIILHFYPSPHQSHPSFPSLTPSQGLDFLHKSLTSTKQTQLSSFLATFLQHFTALGALWQLGTVLSGSVGPQVCSPQHPLPSTDRHLPSANTSGCQTPRNGEKSRSEKALLNL